MASAMFADQPAELKANQPAVLAHAKHSMQLGKPAVLKLLR